MAASRFIVGIDLGTTNSAISFFDTGEGKEPPLCRVLPIPQVVQPGNVSNLPLLPSFLYLPLPGEQPVGSLALPWEPDRPFVVGKFARDFGAKVPTRLVSSAKSWLCHNEVDRREAILPQFASDEGLKVSPLEAVTRYLQHLVETWNYNKAKESADYRLEQQEIVLTVPASFDAAARDLTIEAARAAGIQNLHLLEEPQAAFYSWIEALGDAWREQVQPGDCILVADVGGGTTDFTLIRVEDDHGNLQLTRLAVGDHLLLGGDNMDLALAAELSNQLQQQGTKLDRAQIQQLSYATREAKERLFSDPQLQSTPVTILGKGRGIVASTIKTELTREALLRVIIDGFLPFCEIDAEPHRRSATGLVEMGLPYASDTAITKYLAAFLRKQAPSLGGLEKVLPTAILFNGGVFLADALKDRLLAVITQWCNQLGMTAPRVLTGTDLDLAVARGAAYYGLVRQGKGIRIRGGTARSYYIGIESALPSIPGFDSTPPLKAYCVAPFGMEEGTEAELPKRTFGLIVGEPVSFRFLSSNARRQDPAGLMLEDWEEGELEELNPIQTTLEGTDAGKTVPVHLKAKVNETGQLELSFVSKSGDQSWRISLDVRAKK